MNEQIYGIFQTLERAEQAIAALKDHGVEYSEVSVIHSDGKAGAPIVEHEADHSLTTTSAGDVAAGAEKGGAIGLALGIIGGVIALSIPGIGPILAAGPLWAALGATMMTTAAGVVGGSVVGFLVDQGVPEAAAARYGEALTRGDVIISVRSSHISNADAILMLQKYGAVEIDEHPLGAAYTQSIADPLAPAMASTTAAPTVVVLEPLSASPGTVRVV